VNIQFVDPSELLVYFDMIAEPSNRVTILHGRSSIEDLRGFYRSGETSLKLLDITDDNMSGGLKFKAFNQYFEAFGVQIEQLRSSGLLDYWQKRLKDRYQRIESIEYAGPQVLTLDQLSYGFCACMIVLLLAAVAFTAEFLWPSLKAGVRNLVGFIVVRAYLETTATFT
jgi:hypothetical protein